MTALLLKAAAPIGAAAFYVKIAGFSFILCTGELQRLGALFR